jgi:hypothetical protein
MLDAMMDLAAKSEPSQILMMGDSGAMGSGKSWDDETFGAMLQVLVERDYEDVEQFMKQFAAARDEESLARAVQMAMNDNYINAGVALAKLPQVPRTLPVIAWAAFNKHTYKGLPTAGLDADGKAGTEFALVRTLEWAGFDIDAQDEDNGYTALHYFASTKVHPYTNARAVNWLLKHGADASIANKNGDTALIYCAASVRWNNELSASFVEIFADPTCDPWAKANDGMTARMIMEENDPKAPDEQRQTLIAQMVKMEMSAEIAEAPSGKKRRPLSL